MIKTRKKNDRKKHTHWSLDGKDITIKTVNLGNGERICEIGGGRRVWGNQTKLDTNIT
jgi:hypothetical protein